MLRKGVNRLSKLLHMSEFNLDNYLNQSKFDDDYTKLMIRSAYDVIERLEAWTIIRTFGSNPNNSFMWSNNEQINKIMNAVNNEYEGHSGASLACIMRNMHEISLLK